MRRLLDGGFLGRHAVFALSLLLAVVALGFVVTTLSVNHRYQGFGWGLTAIDAGHWLGVLLIMGALIGWFGAAAG